MHLKNEDRQAKNVRQCALFWPKQKRYDLQRTEMYEMYESTQLQSRDSNYCTITFYHWEMNVLIAWINSGHLQKTIHLSHSLKMFIKKKKKKREQSLFQFSFILLHLIIIHDYTPIDR